MQSLHGLYIYKNSHHWRLNIIFHIQFGVNVVACHSPTPATIHFNTCHPSCDPVYCNMILNQLTPSQWPHTHKYAHTHSQTCHDKEEQYLQGLFLYITWVIEASHMVHVGGCASLWWCDFLFQITVKHTLAGILGQHRWHFPLLDCAEQVRLVQNIDSTERGRVLKLICIISTSLYL